MIFKSDILVFRELFVKLEINIHKFCFTWKNLTTTNKTNQYPLLLK